MRKTYSNPDRSNAANEPAYMLLESPVPSEQPRRAIPQSEAAEPRVLRPGQASLAWERLKRVIRDHCKHSGPVFLPFRIYGGIIEFHSAQDGPVIALTREDSRILIRVNGTWETISIVRLKANGTGFEFRGHRYSATRVMLEIIHDARIASLQLASGTVHTSKDTWKHSDNSGGAGTHLDQAPGYLRIRTKSAPMSHG